MAAASKGKIKAIYICSDCGYESAKWQGKCPDCGAWNTLQEENRAPVATFSREKLFATGKQPSEVKPLTGISADESVRYHTGMEELDRVLGGGIVPGAVTLICGDPGIGKSTVLLQMCRTINTELKILYVSGEESLRQIKLRANRLGVDNPNIYLTSSTDAEEIYETILAEAPQIVIIDSIQTLTASTSTSSAGSVSQVRECAQILSTVCKSNEIPLFIVGHVNKDGGIAGPRVLEHMVDTVLYFEGDKNMSYRIMRAIKNRFGSTNEIGVFEMCGSGLEEVKNPSEVLLDGRPTDVSGTSITCLLEGTRPLLVEVQALITKSSFGNPRRVSTGFDYNRAALLIAVLEKRVGLFMGNLDVFINIAGGLRADDPSADLAVVLAMVSNLFDKTLDPSLIMMGEIGLTGEIRAVSQISQRVSEGYRLGFRKFMIPKGSAKVFNRNQYPDAELIAVSNLTEVFRQIGLK